jgi:hypothetical protein
LHSIATGDCPFEVEVKGFGESADGIYYLADQLHDGLPYYQKEGKNISLLIQIFNLYIIPKRVILTLILTAS